MPFSGVTAGILMAFVYPSLIDTMTFLPELLLRYERAETLKEKRLVTALIVWRLTRNSFLILIALFACGGGLYSTILELIHES